jgi:hypothetical protein
MSSSPLAQLIELANPMRRMHLQLWGGWEASLVRGLLWGRESRGLLLGRGPLRRMYCRRERLVPAETGYTYAATERIPFMAKHQCPHRRLKP